MINLVIFFPITSIQEINQRGQQDRTAWSQWFQDTQVSLQPHLLLVIHARSNPVAHMLDVWLQSRLVRGRRDRSTLDLKISFFSSLTILWGSLTWTALTEDLLMCSYTRYVWRRHQFAWMFCRAWYSFPAFYVAPLVPCLWMNWVNPLHWRHISRGEWHSMLIVFSEILSHVR